MVVSITANASARYAQNSLIAQSAAVTKSTLRMSTGQRVLNASDDAAAMAIGTSLKIENSGLQSAIQNASTGTSMLQIADGALGQISDLITRMQSLAVQSSSGQYDDATRTLLDNEFEGLKQEVDRLAAATTFNGVTILSGTQKYNMASGASATTSTTGAFTPTADGVKDVRLDPAVVTGDASFRYSYDASTESLTVSKVDGATTTSQTLSLTPLLNGSVGQGANLQGNQALEVGFSQLGITLTLGAGFNRNANINNTAVATTLGGNMTIATPAFAAASTNVGSGTVADLTALGSVYTPATGALTLPLVASGAGGTVTLGAVPGLSYKVNGGATGASGAASADIAGAGATVEVFADVAGGGQVSLGTVTVGAVAATAAGSGSLQLNAGGGLITATEDDTVIAPTHLTYKVGTGVLAGQDTIGVDIPAMTVKALNLTSNDITTQANANSTIDALAAALTTLNQGRATVGAQQLRLEAVAANLGTISDNNEAARSSLMDVDVSKEITDLTTSQTLMQASIAMLSKANQTPDLLLELLKN